LPADTPVGFTGKWEGAQLYTEARLNYFGAEPLGTTPETFLRILQQLGQSPDEVLTNLDRLGIAYFIWERPASPPEAWRSLLLSTDFLRQHTRILAGHQSGYLFQIVPGGGAWSGDPNENLLQDPSLERLEDGGPWAISERSKVRRKSVTLRARDSLAQRVPIAGDGPNLLFASIACAGPEQRAELSLRWLDDHDTILDSTVEAVNPGTIPNEQFVWHMAPARATSVSVEISADRGAECEVYEVAFYAP
jgi:hypothetical protein